jgi:hypothetical protein
MLVTNDKLPKRFAQHIGPPCHGVFETAHTEDSPLERGASSRFFKVWRRRGVSPENLR